MSRIKPLLKQGKSFQFTNYRPISLLPSMSKIYEHVVFEQLLNYMEDVAIALSTIAITHLYIISIQIAIMSIVKPCLHITMK